MQPTHQIPESKEAPSIILTDSAQYYLQQAGRWANFTGIAGFVVTGILIATLAKVNSIMPHLASMGIVFYSFYMLIVVFNFFLSLYLFHFSRYIKSGIFYHYTANITLAFSKLRSFFKLCGIAVIFICVFIFVSFIIVGIGAALMK